MIDFHAHVLPNVDDGSRDVTESIKMLTASYSQGVDTIVATPHFHVSRESLNGFQKRRTAAYNALMDAADGLRLPELQLGAEVEFFSGMSKSEELYRLCAGESEYILIEMPFSIWTAGTMSEIYSIINNLRLTPVIAHIERYPDFDDGNRKLNELLEMGAVFQINAELVIARRTRRRAISLLTNTQCILGSDCHNMESRAPNIGEACKIIEKQLGKAQAEELYSMWREMLTAIEHI